MPFVGRAAGAQAPAELAVEKGGRRTNREVRAREQARFPSASGVAGLGGSGAVVGARREERRLGGEHPVPGRPEFRPEADVRVIQPGVGVLGRRAQRVALERRLAEDGQFVGDAVLDVGLGVLAVLLHRRIVAPGRKCHSPIRHLVDPSEQFTSA